MNIALEDHDGKGERSMNHGCLQQIRTMIATSSGTVLSEVTTISSFQTNQLVIPSVALKSHRNSFHFAVSSAYDMLTTVWAEVRR